MLVEYESREEALDVLLGDLASDQLLTALVDHVGLEVVQGQVAVLVGASLFLQVLFKSGLINELVFDESVHFNEALFDVLGLVLRDFLGVQNDEAIVEDGLAGLNAGDAVGTIRYAVRGLRENTFIGFLIEIKRLQIVGHFSVANLAGGVVLERQNVIIEHVRVIPQLVGHLNTLVDNFHEEVGVHLVRALLIVLTKLVANLHHLLLDQVAPFVALAEHLHLGLVEGAEVQTSRLVVLLNAVESLQFIVLGRRRDLTQVKVHGFLLGED